MNEIDFLKTLPLKFYIGSKSWGKLFRVQKYDNFPPKVYVACTHVPDTDRSTNVYFFLLFHLFHIILCASPSMMNGKMLLSAHWTCDELACVCLSIFPSPSPCVDSENNAHKLFSAKPHSIINVNGPLLQRLGRITEHPALSGGGGFTTNRCRISVILPGMCHSSTFKFYGGCFNEVKEVLLMFLVAIEITADVRRKSQFWWM